MGRKRKRVRLKAEHVEAEAIPEILREHPSDRRESLAEHLADLCPVCWRSFEAGVLPRRALCSALERASLFYGQGQGEEARAEVLRPLYPRHRLALRQARDQRDAFARLVLEEARLPIPWQRLSLGGLSPTQVVAQALSIWSSLENEDPPNLDPSAAFLRAWQAVAKKNIKGNADTQLLEDVTDLVFMEHYMLEFVGKHPDYSEDKWLEIIRKTWNKMSDTAHQFALSGAVRLPESLAPLVHKAVAVDG